MARVNTEVRKLLKGTDVVGAKKMQVAGVILQTRADVPGIDAPFVIDFDADIVPGISSWPVNHTESRNIADLISDETENWTGWMIQLAVCKRNNPKTNKEVDSLTVVKVLKPQDAAKQRKTKPKYTVAQKGKPAVSAEDIPF